MNFIVETSARHVHVSQEDLEILFGKGYELTKKKDLSQPGQYACNEKVTIVGSKKEMAASILGPVRPASQVEISLTDARSIGVDAPVRESGDVAGSGACKLTLRRSRAERGRDRCEASHPCDAGRRREARSQGQGCGIREDRY